MALFDYIKGDEFRACLESDYAELQRTLDAQAWKAAHVLAGSIVEAVLVDYLVESGHTNPDPLTLTLGEAVAQCVKRKVISAKTAAIANAIREYRNLVHSGRQIRLGEVPDANGAKIAQALVEMVVSETSAKRQESYGYTAEQVLSKLERDPSAQAILGHLLKEPREVERLLLRVLPARFAEVVLDYDPFADDNRTATLSKLLRDTFRAAFGLATDDVKAKVMKRYVTILKEEGGDYVQEYEEAFVRAPDFKYLEPDDLSVVKQHIFSRLASRVDAGILGIVDGMATCLQEEEVHSLVAPLVRVAALEKDGSLRKRARDVLEGFRADTSRDQDMWIARILRVWARVFEKRGNAEAREVVEAIKLTYESVDKDYDPWADE